MRQMFLIVDVESKETFLPEEYGQLKGIRGITKKLKSAFKDDTTTKCIRVSSDHECFKPRVREKRALVRKDGNTVKGYEGRKLYVFANGEVKYTRNTPEAYLVCVDIKHCKANMLDKPVYDLKDSGHWETGIKKNSDLLL